MATGMQETDFTPDKASPDWEVIKRVYCSTLDSVRQIARAHSISHTAIAKRAAAEEWKRPEKAAPHAADTDSKASSAKKQKPECPQPTSAIPAKATTTEPERVAYEGKSAIVHHDKALQARRSTLMDQYAMATMAGDEGGQADAREAIERFNEKNPNRAIRPMQLAQSIRMRLKRIEQAESGVYLPNRRRDSLDEGRFALQD